MPHPLLTKPTLYLADVPRRVTWTDIEPLFKKCGTVTSAGRTRTASGNRTKWTVHFEDLFYAEMALATLQNVLIPNIEPPFSLSVSHSPDLASSNPLKPLFSQYVKSKVVNHPLLLCTAQKVFQWFRHAGPLVSVRVNVDIGFPERTCILEYWEEEDAQYARTHCHTLHSSLKGMQPFTLRTFNPATLLCSNFGPGVHENDIRGRFKRFGKIINMRIVHPRTVNCHAFITYSKREEAVSALREMKDRSFGQNKIYVRFFEPGVQDTFRSDTNPGTNTESQAEQEPKRSESTNQREYTKPNNAWFGTDNQHGPPPQPQAQTGPESQKDERDRAKRLEELQRLRGEAQRLRAEASAALERNAKKREAAIRATQVAKEAEEKARSARQAEETKEMETTAGGTEVEARHGELNERMSEAEAAVAEAERMLNEAKRRRDEIAQELQKVRGESDSAKTKQEDSVRRRRAALSEEVRLQAAREQMQIEEEETIRETQKEDEEVSRRADLAESVWKMNDLYVGEDEGRQNSGRSGSGPQSGDKGDAPGERRPGDEDIEEEERRQRAYEVASATERARCKRRDQLPWSQLVKWSSKHAVDRFKAVSLEFDEIKFSGVQPLTFESVPWPDLRDPNKLRFEHIDWSSVEKFFSEMRALLDASEYKEIVVKAHRRFHPDKWRARGLLSTVLDADLRSQLEAAGLVVSQSLTPLWRECN